MIAAHTTWSLPLDPRRLSPLRADVAEVTGHLGASVQLQSNIALATSEAAANAMVHAYRRRPPGAVKVTVGASDERILVIVADDGDGLATRLDSPGAGMGLPLIETLSDRLEINDRAPSGTELVMHFLINGN